MPAKKDKPIQLTPQPTWELLLTKVQLLHLRDVLSVLLPPDGSRTVSQALAASEQRSIAETQLWAEVSALCKSANIPLNKEAPDFVVMTTGAPILDVIRIADDMGEEEQLGPDGDPSALFHEPETGPHFHPGDDDDGGAPEPTKPTRKKPARQAAVTKGKRK